MFLAIMQRLFSILIIAASICVGYWSFRLAKADYLSQQDSIPSRKAAANLTPGNAKCWIRLAHLQQQHGLDALTSFAQAAKANQFNADAFIGLGLEQELAGRLDLAERSLLHAAELSKEIIPRSTLANFYFRRNDPAHFWPWARQALLTATDDQQSIFRMCWALSHDAAQIATLVLPDRILILRQYLVWLSSTGRLDAAAPVAARLLTNATEPDAPALLFYCDAQVVKGRIDASKEAWAQLLAKRLIPPAEEFETTGLVNGQFQMQPMNSGLDWRFAAVPGVNVRPTFPGLRITFSGSQPENCAPVAQYISLESGRRYKLWYEYQTTDIPPGSGLAWRVYDATGRVEFTKDPPSLAHEKMGRESVTFFTPPDTRGGLLSLSYIRAQGTTRINGWLQLKQAGLETAH